MGVQLPSEPINRHEQYLAKIAGQAVEIPAEPITREEAYLDAIAKGSGGGGGTSDYPQLTNKPQINGNTLVGNKTASQLGLASTADLAEKVDKVDGKDLSSNDYSDTEKQKNADNATAISAIKDGATIDSFADVESALSNKQDTLTFDNVPTENSNNPVKSGGVKSAIDAAVSSAYHHAGTKTCTELVAGLLVAGNEGNVYNMTDSGTTTADFIEGAGQPIKAGDNVGIAKISDGVYKFDLLSGFVDTSNFVQKSATAGLLKNDGTVDTTIQGDVSTLKSGLTNLDSEVNGDATVYPYADVITIPDAVPSNLADCNVKIEPDQDLHGYDKPWVGGAGKNKLPLRMDWLKATNTTGTWSGNVYSANGATVTILTDNDDNIVGIKAEAPNTPSDTVQFNLCYKGTGNIFDDIENKSVTMNGCPTGGSENTYYIQFYKYDGTLQIKDTGAGVTFTPSNIPEDARVRITIKSAIPSGGVIFYPMLRLATETDDTFAPYTNICPITGHTEASVQRDGKNKFNKDSSDIANNCRLSTITGRVYGESGYKVSDFIPVKPNTGYVLTTSSSFTSYCAFYSDKASASFISGIGWNSEASVVTPNNAKYVRFDFNSSDIDGVQLEKGSTATPYVPYAGKTYTILFKDTQGQTITVYGSDLNVKNGTLTVNRAGVDMGTLTWTYHAASELFTEFFDTNLPNDSIIGNSEIAANIISPLYKTIPSSNIAKDGYDNGVQALARESRRFITCDKRYSNAADYTNAVDGNILVYELATPFTVQLTPQQIQLLQGTNTLTASTGQISVTVNGVSGSIGSVQTQANATDAALAELSEKLPTAPTTDGTYSLQVTVASGVPTYSWVSGS